MRPVLEYNSVIWSPSLKKDINLVESVQRKFTKRLPGLSTCSYSERLKILSLETLEMRRLRNDLTTLYKLIFENIITNQEQFFTLNESRNVKNLRGHKYQLNRPVFLTSCRRNFFINRISGIWNELPSKTDFSSYTHFRNSVSNEFLLNYCKTDL